MRRLAFACLLASLLQPARSDSANLLVNPDFELGTPTSAWTTLHLGSTAITGWTVTDENVDIVGSYWISHHGHRGVDLQGTLPGCLAQTLTTVPGATYKLTFWMAGNPCGTPLLKSMRVSAAGQSADFSFNTAGHTTASMGWVQKSWQFVANGTSATLQFCDLATTGSCGVAIDDMDLEVDSTSPTHGTSWGRLKVIYR